MATNPLNIPEILEQVMENVDSFGVLAYYIRTCKPSKHFIRKLGNRPIFFLYEYGLSRNVYKDFTSRGYKIMQPWLYMFYSRSPKVLIKALLPYHKMFFRHPVVCFDIVHERLTLEECMPLMECMKQEHDNLSIMSWYWNDYLIPELESMDTDKVDWLIDNVFSGCEDIGVSKDTPYTKSIRLLDTGFYQLTIGKIMAIAYHDTAKAYTVLKNCPEVCGEFAHTCYFAIRHQDDLSKVRYILKKIRRRSGVLSNPIEALHCVNLNGSVIELDELVPGFEPVDVIAKHIGAYTEDVLKRIHRNAVIYVLESAMYLNMDEGITMFGKVAPFLKHEAYAYYSSLIKYILFTDLRYYQDKYSPRDDNRIIQLLDRYNLRLPKDKAYCNINGWSKEWYIKAFNIDPSTNLSHLSTPEWNSFNPMHVDTYAKTILSDYVISDIDVNK